MTDALTQVPAELVAGDTWTWTRALADYPAPTWTAKAFFENAAKSFNATAAASGTDHVFTIGKATTSGYPPGRYRWRVTVDNGTVRKTIEQGWTEVRPDPEADGTVDHRSDARVMLEMVTAYLRDPSNVTAAAYTIGGRSLSRWNRKELHDERDRLKAEVAAEDRRDSAIAGRSPRNRLLARL